MSGNYLMFSLILVLKSAHLIHSQLLTLQNIPQWRSIVSVLLVAFLFSKYSVL